MADDLDDILNSLGDPAPVRGGSRAPVPAAVNANNGGAGASRPTSTAVSQGELDDLLNGIGISNATSTRASVSLRAGAQAPPAQAPMSTNTSRPVSGMAKSDLDLLLQDLEGTPAGQRASVMQTSTTSPSSYQTSSQQQQYRQSSAPQHGQGQRASVVHAAVPQAVPPPDELDQLIGDMSQRETRQLQGERAAVQPPVGRERGKTVAALEAILSELPPSEGEGEVVELQSASAVITHAARGVDLDSLAPASPSTTYNDASVGDDLLAPRSALRTETNKRPGNVPQTSAPYVTAVDVRTVQAGLVSEINFLRTQPRDFAHWLQTERRPYFKDKKLVCPGWTQFLPTAEGAAAVDECIRLLQTLPPLPPLEAWPGLQAATARAVADCAPKGLMKKHSSIAHLSACGVDPAGERVVELLGFGVATARELVARLVVGDGDATRYDRAALLDPAFRFVGAAYGDHQSAFKRMLCVTLAEGFQGAPEPPSDLAPRERLQARQDGALADPSQGVPVASQAPRHRPEVAPIPDTLPTLLTALHRFDDAVKRRAAREAMAEATKMPGAIGQFKTDDPNAVGPLNDAVDRLRKILKGLLGCGKNVLQEPRPGPSEPLFDKLVDEFRKQAQIADALSRGDLSSLDTVKTHLAASGMVDAAAAAARQLQDAFK